MADNALLDCLAQAKLNEDLLDMFGPDEASAIALHFAVQAIQARIWDEAERLTVAAYELGPAIKHDLTLSPTFAAAFLGDV